MKTPAGEVKLEWNKASLNSKAFYDVEGHLTDALSAVDVPESRPELITIGERASDTDSSLGT